MPCSSPQWKCELVCWWYLRPFKCKWQLGSRQCCNFKYGHGCLHSLDFSQQHRCPLLPHDFCLWKRCCVHFCLIFNFVILQLCDNVLDCSVHKCEERCHASEKCGKCPRSGARSCPCGKSSNKLLRIQISTFFVWHILCIGRTYAYLLTILDLLVCKSHIYIYCCSG